MPSSVVSSSSAGVSKSIQTHSSSSPSASSRLPVTSTTLSLSEHSAASWSRSLKQTPTSRMPSNAVLSSSMDVSKSIQTPLPSSRLPTLSSSGPSFASSPIPSSSPPLGVAACTVTAILFLPTSSAPIAASSLSTQSAASTSEPTLTVVLTARRQDVTTGLGALPTILSDSSAIVQSYSQSIGPSSSDFSVTPASSISTTNAPQSTTTSSESSQPTSTNAGCETVTVTRYYVPGETPSPKPISISPSQIVNPTPSLPASSSDGSSPISVTAGANGPVVPSTTQEPTTTTEFILLGGGHRSGLLSSRTTIVTTISTATVTSGTRVFTTASTIVETQITLVSTPIAAATASDASKSAASKMATRRRIIAIATTVGVLGGLALLLTICVFVRRCRRRRAHRQSPSSSFFPARRSGSSRHPARGPSPETVTPFPNPYDGPAISVDEINDALDHAGPILQVRERPDVLPAIYMTGAGPHGVLLVAGAKGQIESRRASFVSRGASPAPENPEGFAVHSWHSEEVALGGRVQGDPPPTYTPT
ncbi:hypothetical protein C8F01DRAFT_1106734 [Mycena amicta]|nr:hypothetical protein C8F01DRAFT_1106734 [Mycena amicta]